MSKDKKDKGSKKAKSQGEVVTEAMANVTSNAEAAKAAIKAGKKLAKERIELEDPILALSAPRPVEIVEPQEPQRSVLTAYDKPGKKERKAAEARLNGVQGVSAWDGNVSLPQNPGESTHTLTSNGGTITVTHMGESELKYPPIELTPESMATSAAPRTRTDNLLVLLKQAQESADLDNLPQLVECPRKYTTKNYGVQLVKKYAAEGINAEATEDTFIEPDRDHPKGMWQVTLRIKPNTSGPVSEEAVESQRSEPTGEIAQDISTSDLPKPVVNPEKVDKVKTDKKKAKKKGKK